MQKTETFSLGPAEIRVRLLRPNARLPERATNGSVGYDLCAAIDEPVTIQPGETVFIGSGIAIELPEDASVAGLVFARSGLGSKHGIVLANGVGVIDGDYRGECRSILYNRSKTPYTIQPGDRVAQLVFVPVLIPRLVEAAELSETGRGAGGYGSTGR